MIDDQLSGSGVSFNFRYVGNIHVAISMRSLEFETRTDLTRECIYQVCKKAKLISTEHNHHSMSACFQQLPTVELINIDVDFVISTRSITVVHADTTQPHMIGSLLIMHALPNVSFASAGDQDDVRGRRCFVYKCGRAIASRVLKTISDAFSMRFGSTPQPPPATMIDMDITVPLPILSPSPNQIHEYVNEPKNWENNIDMLNRELWYHGAISRETATRLLTADGDFLVRQSSGGDEKKLVLTGMQNGIAKHLLLIDDNGKVRTKDREFQNVSHLIQYHRDNRIPITSEESALLLLTPIRRTT